MQRYFVKTVLVLLVTLPTIPVTANARYSPEAIKAPMAASSLLLGGTVVGDKMWTVGERGHVLISSDKGANWVQADSVPTRAALTSVYFINDQLGWAVGHEAVILRTRDGGQHWQKIFSAPELDQPLLDIWFQDAERGFAIGAYGYFLETSDGGENWRERRIGEDDWHLNRIARMENGKMFIAAEAGTIYRSEDGGQNWSLLLAPYEGSFHGLIPLGGESLMIFGLRGHLLRSDDAGDNWYEVDSGVKTLLTGAVLLADGRLALSGVAGAVLLSNQEMSEFVPLELPDRRSLTGVLSNGSSLIAFGEGGALRLPLDKADITD